MFRGVACLLLLLSGVVLLASYEGINGHGMRRHEFCLYMPTVEECQYEAERLITDTRFKKCVIKQCANSENLCADDTFALEIAVLWASSSAG